MLKRDNEKIAEAGKVAASMGRKVIAVGLDSVGFPLLDRFVAAGFMPEVRKLLNRGCLARLESTMNYAGGAAPFASTEGNWVMFQTGVRPSTSGYWETIRFDPQTYRATNDFCRGGYDYQEFPPFYALGDRHRVVTFDIPVSARVADVEGEQVVGWGGHFPYVMRGSQPKGLLGEIQSRHGKNKVLYKDHGVFWSQRYRRWLERACVESMEQRANICDELLDRNNPDLLVTVLGETHSALHDLWAASDTTHAVHESCRGDHDPLQNVFREVDRTIGRMARRAEAQNGVLMLFSVHGMQANSTDLPCLFFLAELMYRFQFPGKAGIALGDAGIPPPAPIASGLHWYWFGEIWRRRHSGSMFLDRLLSTLPAWLRWQLPGRDLRYPFFMNPTGPENGWLPAMWYRPAWPRMRSFALPAFADGHVRINLAGRESKGLVGLGEYDKECQRVREFLLRVKDARTGRHVVRDVICTRKPVDDDDPRLPPGDLVVVWTDEPFDVIDSPDVGRIGPVPFFRTGGHRPGGFALMAGAGVPRRQTLPAGEITDLAPTILDLIGASIPSHFDGRSLLRNTDRQKAVVG